MHPPSALHPDIALFVRRKALRRLHHMALFVGCNALRRLHRIPEIGTAERHGRPSACKRRPRALLRELLGAVEKAHITWSTC